MIAIIAFSGVVLASVYALRLFIRAMHNRVGPSVDSREISPARDVLVLVPLVAVILVPRALPAAGAAPQRRLGQERRGARKGGLRAAAYALAPAARPAAPAAPLSTAITRVARP